MRDENVSAEGLALQVSDGLRRDCCKSLLVVWSFPAIDGYCSRCWSAVDAFSVGVLNVGDVRDDRAHDSVVVYDPGIRAQPVPVEWLQVFGK
jgi:hypothetical protein